MYLSFPERGTAERASKFLIVNNLTVVGVRNSARNRIHSTEHSNITEVKMNATREYRKTFHVRLKPSPALILNTSTYVADRLEVSDLIPTSAGVYRRVSAKFIESIRAERDAESKTSQRWARLDEILTAALSTPGTGDCDLENFPTPDVSCY